MTTSPTGSVTAAAPSPPPPPPLPPTTATTISLNPDADVFERSGEASNDEVLSSIEEETTANILGSTVDTPCSEITDPPWISNASNADYITTESKFTFFCIFFLIS